MSVPGGLRYSVAHSVTKTRIVASGHSRLRQGDQPPVFAFIQCCWGGRERLKRYPWSESEWSHGGYRPKTQLALQPSATRFQPG